MIIASVFSLCDQIVAAIKAKQPTWDCQVILHPGTDVSKIPTTGVELRVGPMANEEAFVDGSRRTIGSQITIAMRLRSLLADKNSVDEARAKAALWDEAVGVLQRQEGYNLGATAGAYKWESGLASFDFKALKNDRVVSICATEITFTAVRANPKSGA